MTTTLTTETETPAPAPTRPGARPEAPGAGLDTPEDELGEAGEGAEAGADAFAPEGFVPDTPEKADWVLGKIADARARAARVRQNAEIIARQHDADAEALEWRFGPALQAFARRELTGKRKSLRLYNGVIGFRTKAAGVSVTDAGAALAWARESLPAAVVETLDRRALSARLLDTAESVDFASFTPEEEVFYIK